MTKTVAVLGLGAMGTRIAHRLLDAGNAVRVYNRTPHRRAALVDAGAEGFDTPKQAATGADVVLSMVRDDAASSRVWADPQTGALAGMRPGSVALECSTLSVPGVLALAEAAAAHEIVLLDAPVVGTRPQAESGKLVFLIGGDASALEDVRALLGVLGSAAHHVGPLGQGAAMKLAVNAFFGIQVAALGELLATLRAGGVEPERAMEVLGALAVCSPAAKGMGGLMVAEQFGPMFPVELVAKDFGYALDLARRASIRAPMTAAARGVYEDAAAAGYGDENLVAVAKLYR